ncbi:roadblock/LC7 domain-containing protein [Dyella acidisoli]
MFALRDGRSYAERCRSTLSINKFAAMSSSLVALSNSVLREIAADTLSYLLIEGEGHKLVLCKVTGSKSALILSIMAKHEINLGLVLGLAKMCVKEVVEAELSASAAAQ